MKKCAEAMADALHRSVFRREVKEACCAYGNAPNRRADVLARERVGTNDVATRLACVGPVRTKPYLSMRHICRDPEP